jgi:hypothetical protein
MRTRTKTWRRLPWTVALAAAAAPGAARGQTIAQRLVFNSVAPCRIADTRFADAGALTAGETRTFHVVGSASDFADQGGTAGGCAIPGFAGPVAQAQAVAFNFVAVNPAGAGNLRAWPSDLTAPNASIINYAQVGLNIANGIAVPVRQDSEGSDLSLRADASGTHVVIDVVGYYRLVTQLDGSGSGIDADLLDGLDAGAFAAAGHDHDAQYSPIGHEHDARYWNLGGNAGTTPGTQYLGTSDAQPLELKVNGERALRIEPNTSPFPPNLIGGHAMNFAAVGVRGAFVGGGGSNTAGNRVTADFGTVAGGHGNHVSSSFGFVGGGDFNVASGPYAAVMGGANNFAQASHAVVGGGFSNVAGGATSFVAGNNGRASHAGVFVWADSQAPEVASTGADQFIVRALGGMWLGSTSVVSIAAGRLLDTDTGAHLTLGGAWTNASDSALKENFAPIDGRAVLDAVARLRLASWNYRAEGEEVRHLGPTAQDFHAAFGLGADDRSITTVDTAGVALAAIQELDRRTRQVEALSQEVRELRGLVERLLADGGR